MKQYLKGKVKKESEKEYRKSPRYERASKYDPKAPISNFRKITMKLTRRQASILVQLRTGHAPLQAYLHRFKLVESPMCPSCGEEPETVTHFLIYCESHHEHRRRLRWTLGRDQSLELGILGDVKRIRALMRFIDETERFKESHGNLRPTEGEEEEEEEDGQR